MTITVFVADDHAIVREGLANLLVAQTDIRVVGTAADGRDTVRQVETLKPAVVVMDISMPQMNGIEAARAAHAGRRYLSPRVAEVLADNIGRSSAGSPLESLSARERQVLQLVAEGRTSALIAQTLHLSPKSVDTYRSRLMQKLHIGDIAGLVKFAIVHGLTSLE